MIINDTMINMKLLSKINNFRQQFDTFVIAINDIFHYERY